MSKKALRNRHTSTPSWKKVFEAITENADGPYLWRCETEVWHALSIDLNTLRQEEPDDVHKFDWISVEMEYDGIDGEAQREEIPFWSKKSFFRMIHEHGDEVDDLGVLDCWFKRVKLDEKNNDGTFRFGTV